MSRYCLLQYLSMAYIIMPFIFFCACSTSHKANGWYPIGNDINSKIIGKPLATVRDFCDIALIRDSICLEGDTIIQVVIQGNIKPEKLHIWIMGTERLIGNKLGFVFNDSIIIAPKINASIESGKFQINSSDTILLNNIYESLKQEIKQD